jgi:ABC-type bacteriocin/lantibiotic exporter with double-glycine peptidase domain
MTEPIVQQDRTGCGIACAAMLAGVSYAEAKAAAVRLGIAVEDSRLWSDTSPLRRLLETYGIALSSTPKAFSTWDALPDRALLAIKWHLERGVPHWHWVVFERQEARPCVLDPKRDLRQHRRTDFGRMKPKWWLEVLARTDYLP